MSNPRGIAVKILGKEIQVNCPEGQEHELLDAAYYLDQSMNSIRKQGRVIGVEKIAIMAALNMAHELLEVRNSREEYIRMMDSGLQRLTDKLQNSLKAKSPEAEQLEISMPFTSVEEEIEA